MSHDPKRRHLSEIPLIYPDPGPMNERRDVEYARTETGSLTFDIYAPASSSGSVALPAIVLVVGFSDVGFVRFLGARYKDMAMARSWGRLVASFGLVGITYCNATNPQDDLEAVLQYVRTHGAELGVDADRLGLWAFSGNGPLALAALVRAPRGSFRCGVFSCAFTFDQDGATHVGDAARQWQFANPGGFGIDAFPVDLPILFARAGQEQDPGLNHAMDRLIASALARNLPITCVNVAGAPHAFEMFHDTLETREVTRQMFRFARFHLAGTSADGVNV